MVPGFTVVPIPVPVLPPMSPSRFYPNPLVRPKLKTTKSSQTLLLVKQNPKTSFRGIFKLIGHCSYLMSASPTLLPFPGVLYARSTVSTKF